VEPGVNVTVATAGTGGGFQKFCAGETDISDASRPIKDEEAAACKAKGIDYTEVIVANDGLSVVVNPENSWATCLTVEQLKTMWSPKSEGKIKNWNQIDNSFPDQPLTLFGAGTDSGTFDYFTEAINGEEGASRTDYSPSEDDNVTIQGVKGDKGAVGYFGLSYVEQNPDAVKAVEVDGGGGCVAPSKETVQDKSYKPLARPLFIYVKNSSYKDNAAVRSYVDFYIENEAKVAEEALFVGLTPEQKKTAQDELASIAA
jgi:phosphate binding protein